MTDPGPWSVFGREREGGILSARLTEALAGQGSFVLISGEAGIGKTALANLLCHEALERGAQVLIGRCYDLSETPPYGPWHELFDHYRASDAPVPLPEAFAVRDTIGAVTSQSALFQSVRDFLESVSARQCLVLLLDDLHWADSASLDLLRFLARAVATLPVLIVGIYRDEEVSRQHPLYALLPLLVREAHAWRIDLQPLDAAAVRALVDTRYYLPVADTERLVTYIQGRAEGNALFLGELLRALEEMGTLHRDDEVWMLGTLTPIGVPALLRQVIDGRVARLGEDAVRLLAVAAVVGQSISLDVWAAAAAVDEEHLIDLVERAVAARLLDEVSDGAGVRFAHALVRETLYENIPAVRRRGLHQRIGAKLTENPSADPDAVAYHFEKAGNALAVSWLIIAGYRALRLDAWSISVARLEAALNVADSLNHRVEKKGWIILQLAWQYRFLDLHRSIQYLETAEYLAIHSCDRALIAVLHLGRGYFLCRSGKYRDGIGLMEGAIQEIVQLSSDDRRRIDDHYCEAGIQSPAYRGTLLNWLTIVGDYRRARILCDDLPQDEWDGDAWSGQATLHAEFGEFVDARRALAEAGRHYRTAHLDYVELTHAVYLLTLALTYAADERDLIRRLLEAFRAAEERVRDRTPEKLGPAPLQFFIVTGSWHEAEQRMHRSSTIATLGVAVNTRLDLDNCLGIAQLALLRGEFGVARAVASEACVILFPHGVSTEPGDSPFQLAIAWHRCFAVLARENADSAMAQAWLEAHDRWLEWSGATHSQAEGHLAWAMHHRTNGDHDQAWTHSRQAADSATEPRQPLALLAAHRLLGALATDAKQYDAAVTHLDTALALADACAAPYERALTLLELAALQIATGETAAANATLHEVQAICLPLGAKPALAHADTLLKQLNPEDLHVPRYPAGLSAREVEVLRLVAQGLTNPQVADRLSLSRRTVEQHLRSIYNKLDVPTRAAATAFAVQRGLV